MKKIIFLAFFLATNSFANTFEPHTQFKVCFTPGHRCIKELTNAIGNAQNSIYMQAYSFNSFKISRALVRAHDRGVNVNVILDKTNFQAPYNYVMKYLKRHHVSLWEDYKPNIAHNKVVIIDKKLVETGSFNYTTSAEKYNAENMLFIHSPTLAKLYLTNWLSRKKQSKSIS